MKYLNYLMACLVLLLAPSAVLGELNTNTVIPECAIASMVAGTCVPLRQGVRAKASGALTAVDCETGGGAFVNTCEYNGNTWLIAGAGRPIYNERIQFCGEQGANTDEFFQGPNLVSQLTGAIPTDHSMGGALCNALGNTAVATVDNDIDEFVGYWVNGMFCRVSAAPGTAATTMTFYVDTVATAVTCDIAAAETSCATTMPAQVAADSQVATSSLNETDDESGQDATCFVYITWIPTD
jgi:hypothetical protein